MTSSPVTATVTGSTVYLTSKAVGSASNYSLSTTVVSSDPAHFNPPSFSATLVILGFMTNRLNVSIIGMWQSSGVHYIPKWSEVAVSAMIVVMGIATFAAAVKYLPIFSAKSQQE